MLPEQQEFQRYCQELGQLEEQVAQAELQLETEKTSLAQFQRRYYQTVGKLFAELDAIEAKLSKARAVLQPSDEHASAPVNRSKLETLLLLTPHMPLYAFLSARGVPSTYQGEIDSAGRLCLTQLH